MQKTTNILNDSHSIGISPNPDQSSKQTQRCLALLNHSLILGKEGKLTTHKVV